MAGFVLIRPHDHPIVGVRWVNCTVSGAGAAARLVAGAGARLILELPPQHVGEEASRAGSSAPSSVTVNGTAVGVWRGVLASSSRLVFDLPAATQIPLSAEGVLAAVAGRPLLTSTGNDTAIELPYRLVIAPRDPESVVQAVCQHRTLPETAGVTALWRTRIVKSTGPGDALPITVVDRTAADAPNPVAMPLSPTDRTRLFDETMRRAARATRLELSAMAVLSRRPAGFRTSSGTTVPCSAGTCTCGHFPRERYTHSDMSAVSTHETDWAG
jgi:hypothetical protein